MWIYQSDLRFAQCDLHLTLSFTLEPQDYYTNGLSTPHNLGVGNISSLLGAPEMWIYQSDLLFGHCDLHLTLTFTLEPQGHYTNGLPTPDNLGVGNICSLLEEPEITLCEMSQI
jgi:hypothetical protein